MTEAIVLVSLALLLLYCAHKTEKPSDQGHIDGVKPDKWGKKRR